MPHRPRRPLILLAAAIALATTVPAGAARSSRDQWQQPDRVVADLGLTDGSVVADVGCGRGYFVFRLAKAVGKTGTVYAEDISEKALKGLKVGKVLVGVQPGNLNFGEGVSRELKGRVPEILAFVRTLV